MSDAKRLRLGAVAAAVVIGYGVSQNYGIAWGIGLALCALLAVAGAAALGDQLARRRAQ